MASATDVPGRFDLVIAVPGGNTTGFMFDDATEGGKKAAYGYSPTFVERQNVQGNYGDDQQSFWLTASQNDWSAGEDQKFFRANDADSEKRYWQGTAADIRIEGQVTIRDAVRTLTTAANPVCAVGAPPGIYFATSTNLYLVDFAGTITNKGAHGLGAAPSTNGIASDGNNIYLTTTTAGTVGVRRYNGAAFSTFSATASDSLAFLNNTLFGFTIAGLLRRYDTAGTPTTLFTFTDAVGASTDTNRVRLCPFGGDLVIFRGYAGNSAEGRAQLWLFDGTGVSLMHSFEPNFYATDMTVGEGIIFLVGTLSPNTSQPRSCVLYLANGTPGLLWKSRENGGTNSSIAAYDGGIVWGDSTNSQYLYWDPATGGIHRFAGPNSADAIFASSSDSILGFRSSTTADLFPSTSTRATSATVTSSLFDFDSSLDKLFRGIKVDFDSATTGNGGSVDIAYQVGGVASGGFTTLQTGAVSGTEYTLTGVTGRNISVKITLNKGTSTAGPVLKRVYVRASPVLLRYRICSYVIACSGNAQQSQQLRDGSDNPKTGRELANELINAVTSSTPVTITDRFGTYTGILEPAQFELDEIHAEPLVPPVKSGSFIARITAREV